MHTATDPVTVPWSTGFEENFCDYLKVAGYCYGDRPYSVVTEPHRAKGRFVAEFKAIGDDQHQTRCVRQGVLPESAFYGAWYYIPEPLKKVKVWNLWHFTGAQSPNELGAPLWDVTLIAGSQPGTWELLVYDPVARGTYRSREHTLVPFGAWFHIELFLKRAADTSGKIALYQDGALLFEQTNLQSDASKYAQWFVGNFAEGGIPADSSLYVDDVTISATLSPTSATP